MLTGSLGVAAHIAPAASPDASETYCERVRALFERTSKLARELASALEGLDQAGADTTAARLAAIREGLAQEAAILRTTQLPLGAEEVRTRGAAALDVLIELAEPRLAETDADARADLAAYLRERFVAARASARAAGTALRQSERGCASGRVTGGMHLLGRRS